MQRIDPAVHEVAYWRPVWTIYKFHDPSGRIARLFAAGVRMSELRRRYRRQYRGLKRIKGNLLLNEGINAAWNLICGAGGTAFNNANSYIGVGDSNTAASASQTGLQASSNKLYKAMDTSYPTSGSSQQAVWRSTFGSSDANWAWNEITVANGNSDSATNLNRLVQSMGTKASGDLQYIS